MSGRKMALDDEDLSAEEINEQALALLDELEESTFDFSEKEQALIEKFRVYADAGKLLDWRQMQRLQALAEKYQ